MTTKKNFFKALFGDDKNHEKRKSLCKLLSNIRVIHICRSAKGTVECYYEQEDDHHASEGKVCSLMWNSCCGTFFRDDDDYLYAKCVATI
jgi:hypothetical protein